MKPLQAFFFTGALYAFLMWAYIVVRISIWNIPPWHMFIDGIAISFWELGIAAFIFSGVCAFFYLSRE